MIARRRVNQAHMIMGLIHPQIGFQMNSHKERVRKRAPVGGEGESE